MNRDSGCLGPAFAGGSSHSRPEGTFGNAPPWGDGIVYSGRDPLSGRKAGTYLLPSGHQGARNGGASEDDASSLDFSSTRSRLNSAAPGRTRTCIGRQRRVPRNAGGRVVTVFETGGRKADEDLVGTRRRAPRGTLRRPVMSEGRERAAPVDMSAIQGKLLPAWVAAARGQHCRQPCMLFRQMAP